jgi:hypothetical protein
MSFLLSNLSHVYAVQRACAELGIRGVMELGDLALRVTLPDREETWPARFLVEADGRPCYADVLMKGTKGFAGWMPYAMRQWPIAASKFAFKRHALQHGVATPAACRDPARISGPFIVKQDRSSFGEGIRGPFLRHDPGDPAQQLQAGEYYENFVVGLIAKAWCWGPHCAALHLHPPSTVTGDGARSIRQLVQALPNPRDNDWALIGRLAAFCGVEDLEAVLPAGKEALVEFRYGSRYDPPAFRNQNLRDQLAGTPLAAQFEAAARTFAAAIPPNPEWGDSLFTLDAIVDRDGEALFLEMNCHPLVHPDLYRPMLASRLAEAPMKKPAEAGSPVLAAA